MTPVTSTTLALAALMNLRGVGRRQALRLVPDRLPAGVDVEAEICSLAAKAGHAADVATDAVLKARDRLFCGSEAGVAALGMRDEGYPSRLRDTPDPPAVLYVKGDARALRAQRAIAVVGTRDPTEYGAKVARKLARRVAEANYVVVSGLAHGCDTLGHEGCLDADGIGVAVLAHGFDKVYPAANRGLAERLIMGGGCLVSEYALGVTPMRNAFAERDRIQSGLSDAVLVVETDVKGGTMHTVRFAREQRRLLACIEHPDKWLGEDKTRGNQKLIADGWAKPIANAEALLDFLKNVAVKADHLQPPAPMRNDHQHAFAI